MHNMNLNSLVERQSYSDRSLQWFYTDSVFDFPLYHNIAISPMQLPRHFGVGESGGTNLEAEGETLLGVAVVELFAVGL